MVVYKQQRDSVGDLLSGDFSAEQVRPSTRLNSKFVGGKSSVFLSHDNKDQETAVVMPNSYANPRRNESHFSLSGEATPMPVAVAVEGPKPAAGVASGGLLGVRCIRMSRS